MLTDVGYPVGLCLSCDVVTGPGRWNPCSLPVETGAGDSEQPRISGRAFEREVRRVPLAAEASLSLKSRDGDRQGGAHHACAQGPAQETRHSAARPLTEGCLRRAVGMSGALRQGCHACGCTGGGRHCACIRWWWLHVCMGGASAHRLGRRSPLKCDGCRIRLFTIDFRLESRPIRGSACVP